MKRYDTNAVWIYSSYVILFLSCTIFKINSYLLSSIFLFESYLSNMLHEHSEKYALLEMWNISEYCAVLCLVAQSCLTLCDPMDGSPPGSSVHEDSPGKNTGVGYHALLQGILAIQGSNPGLLHCRRILYHLSHQGLSFFFFSSVPLPKGLFYYLPLQKANSCFC